MTSRQPGITPPGSMARRLTRLLPAVLLIILGLAGLRGTVATPRWDGPLHRDGVAVGIGLEVVFAALILVTLRRNRSGSQQPVARKLRGMLLLALGAGMAVVAVVTTAGLHLRLFTGKNVLPPGLPRPRLTPRGRQPVPPSHGSSFHFPMAALLYTLLVLLLLAGVVLSVWWARRLQPAFGPRPDAFIAEESEDLRKAVASGRSALRTMDDARAAIIACYVAMENSLAERGAARGVADTPDELLARARKSGIARGTAAARLTALFYEARFSSHPLGRAHREAAERALDELAAGLAGNGAAGAAGGAGAGG